MIPPPAPTLWSRTLWLTLGIGLLACSEGGPASSPATDTGGFTDAAGDTGTGDGHEHIDAGPAPGTDISDAATADAGFDTGGADGSSADSAPDSSAPLDSADTADGADAGADIATPTTCTSAQWAACDDGVACTLEHCHPQQGCLSLDGDGCSTCTRFSSVHGFGTDIEWTYRVVALKSGAWLGAGATDTRGTLVSRSPTGKLRWTLKFGSNVSSGFEGVSLRADGLMWLVGSRRVGGAPKTGWIVRMQQDGKAGLEFAVTDDKHHIELSDAIPGGKSGLVAVGSRTPTVSGKAEGLVIWRDPEGKPTGPQELKLTFGASTTLRAAWRHSADGFLVCGSAGGVLVGRISDAGDVVHKVLTGAHVGEVCRDITYTDKGRIVLVSADAKGKAALRVVAPSLALSATWPYDPTKLQWASAVTPLAGGDVVVAGRAAGKTAPVGALARVDPATGAMKWQRTYGGLDSEFNDVVQGAGGGFAVAGTVLLGEQYRGWMLRVGPDGSLKCP